MADVTFGYPEEWSRVLGFVAVSRPRPLPAAALPLCACGCSKQQCSRCGEWFCAAPGHLQHECVSSREREGAT